MKPRFNLLFLMKIMLILSLTLFSTNTYSQVFSLSDSSVNKGQFIAMYDIIFKFNKPELADIKQSQLDSLIQFLTINQHSKIELAVHTSFRGDDQYNLDISNKRANYLKQYLVQKGIASDRIKAIGYGESKPVIEYEDWENLVETHRCGFYGKGNKRISIVIL